MASIYELARSGRTVPNRIGKVAKTAPEKNKEIMMFGFLGSARKIWWISGSFPYRSGFSSLVEEPDESVSIANVNALLLYPAEEPNDAMTMLASRLRGERRKAAGRSFCDKSTFAFPESFTLKG